MSESDCNIYAPKGLITGDVTVGALYAGKYQGTVAVNTTTEDTTTTVAFTVDVKTENQKDVAEHWNDALASNPLHMDSHQAVGHNTQVPDKLKFYFPVTMTIGGAEFNILLGQGQYGITNNWWIGSMQMASVAAVNIGPVSFFGGTVLIQSIKKHRLPTVNLVTFQDSYNINIANIVAGPSSGSGSRH